MSTDPEGIISYQAEYRGLPVLVQSTSVPICSRARELE
jgi:hypothetical protein